MPGTIGTFVTWLGTSGAASAAATAAATAAVGAVATKAMAKKPVTAPTAIIPTPDKPQEQKAIDQSVLLKRNATAAAGALSGNASTLLTGSGGVSPATLNLGSTSLLGQ